jgi:outer membrane receptor for ferrienterochelin and colicins
MSQADSAKVTCFNDFVFVGMPCPVAAKNSIHSVKVINAATIQQRGVNSLEELLSGETNIRFKADALIGSGIQVGGLGGENVKILIDGVPVLGRLNGNVDLSQIPMYNVEKIEIIQGSLSTIYGSDASGGVINIITRKTQTKAGEIKASSMLESTNIQNHTLNGGYRLKKILLQAGGGFFKFSGLNNNQTRSVDWNPKRQYTGSGTAKYYFTDNQILSFTGSFFKENVDNLGDIKLPEKPTLAYAFDEFYCTTRKDVNLNYQGTWKKLSVQSTVAYNQFDRLKEAFRVKMATTERSFLENQQDTSRFNGFLTRSVAVYQPSERLNFQAGIETFYETAVSGRIIDTSETQKNFARIGDYAVFGAVKFKPFRKIDFTIQPSFRTSYNTKYNAPLTPSVHFLYKPTDRCILRASYANGFRAPSLKELYFNFVDINHNIIGNEALLAEKSDNFIFSPCYIIEKSKHTFSFESQLFYTRIRNKITLYQVDLQTLRFTYFNIGKYETKGVSLSMKYQFDDQLTLKTSIAYTGFYNEKDAGKPGYSSFYYSPETSLEVNYKIPYTGLTVNLLHRFIGVSPIFTYDVITAKILENRLPQYQLMNVTMSRNFWKNRMCLTGGVKNLMNITSFTLMGDSGSGHASKSSEQVINLGRSFFLRAAITLGTKQ